MHKTTFTKARLLHILAQLDGGPGDYLTVYLRHSSSSCHANEPEPKLTPFANEIRAALSTEEVLQEVQRYRTGAVIFWSEGDNRLIILPPFALTEAKASYGKPETLLLRHVLEKERILGLVLVTWGSYAVGVFKGDKLLESKTGTGHIHKRHRRGGGEVRKDLPEGQRSRRRIS